MDNAAAFTILGIVGLSIGWPWWSWVAAFAIAALCVGAERGGSS